MTAPEQAGVLIISDSIGHYGKATTFSIERIARSPKRGLTRLDATIEYRAEGKGTPALRAHISYQA